MAKEILRQRSWNAGELDPDLIGRDDVKVSANAAAWIENCLCIPQGPLVRRPGLPLVDVVRHRTGFVDASGAAWTAPNGGTATDAQNSDGATLLTTTDIGTIHPYVVVEIDFAAPVTISAVDVIDYGLHDTAGGGTAPTAPPISYPWGGDPRIGGFYGFGLGGELP